MTNVAWFDNKPQNHPFDEVKLAMLDHIANGYDVYPKWTCCKCNQRVCATTKNVLPEVAMCPECSGYTNLKLSGANYRLVKALRGPKQLEESRKQLRSWAESKGLKPPC